ncbi:MAG: hypothetical protein ABIN24_01920 [Dyadobacter sp.]
MKKQKNPVLKITSLNRFKGQIWQKNQGKTGDDPITTSGMICTLITRR